MPLRPLSTLYRTRAGSTEGCSTAAKMLRRPQPAVTGIASAASVAAVTLIISWQPLALASAAAEAAGGAALGPCIPTVPAAGLGATQAVLALILYGVRR